MDNQKDCTDILTGRIQLGPYPMEKLKRVPKPTTVITDNIQRFDEREHGVARGLRGEYKDFKPTDNKIRNTKDPLMPNFGYMLWNLPPVDVDVETGIPLMLFVPDRGKLSAPTEVNNAARLLLEVSQQRAQIPDDTAIVSRHIKSTGYFLGADIMGVCELPQWAIYSHDIKGAPVVNTHKYAICVVVDMGYRTTNSSTGYDWFGGIGPQWSYLSAAFIATLLAAYIRKLGYRARVHHAQNYQVLVPPLLLLSGIGELSRPNLVLNPFIGLRYKAAVVTTDIPLEPDQPIDFGLQDFCNKCKKCAEHCPSKSISFDDKIVQNGYEKWPFNIEQCARFRFGNQKGSGCGACIHVCPWNKPKGLTHDLVRWLIAHTPFLNESFIKMDNVLHKGKPDIRYRWQLEL